MQEMLQNLTALTAGRPAVRALLIVLAALVAAKLVDWLVTGLLTSWAKRSKTDLDDRLIAMLHRPVFITVLIVGLWQGAKQADMPANYLLFTLRSLKTVAILIWSVFGLRASRLVIEILSRLEGRLRAIQPSTVPLFENLSRLIIVGGTFYFLLLTWGIDLAGWMVSAGVIGIAVGFAAKDTLANLFSGIFILADAPYKIGDFVNLDSGERGQVTQIGLRSTRLLTRDDIEVTVPNAVIAGAKIINESGGPWQMERVRVKVGVAYGSDIDQVRQILLDIAAAEDHLAAEPEPRVRFRAFGESSLDFELLGWIDEPVLRGRVVDALLCQVYKRFAAEGVEIPYPKRDVYLHRVESSESG